MRLAVSLIACIVPLAAFADPVPHNVRILPHLLYDDGSTITAPVQYKLYYGDCFILPNGLGKIVTLPPGIVTYRHMQNDGDPKTCIYAAQIVDGVESDINTKGFYVVPVNPPPPPPPKKKPAPPGDVVKQ